MNSESALQSIATTLRAGALVAVLLLVVWLLSGVLLLVFAAVLMAAVLRGGANALHRWTGMDRGWALLALVAALLLLVGGVLWWRGPQIADQAVQMSDQFTAELEDLRARVQATSWGARIIDQVRGLGWSALGKVGGYVPTVASSLVGLGGTLIVLIATALFFAVSPALYRDGVLRLLPVPWRPRGAAVMTAMGETLQLWFLGQFVDMAVVTVLTGIGLYTLGVPLAPTLALFAGVLNFVPYIGALAGSLPAILVAAAESPHLALWTVALVAVVQTLEGNVIAPLIQKRTVALPPALTILSQTVLGSLFGVLGLILATPFAAAAMVFVRMVYVESVLEHDSETASRPDVEVRTG